MILAIKLLAFVFILDFILPISAYAYLDPNAGGIFLQVIIPIVFAISAAVTVFWRRVTASIKNIINRLMGSDNKSKDS